MRLESVYSGMTIRLLGDDDQVCPAVFVHLLLASFGDRLKISLGNRFHAVGIDSEIDQVGFHAACATISERQPADGSPLEARTVLLRAKAESSLALASRTPGQIGRAHV